MASAAAALVTAGSLPHGVSGPALQLARTLGITQTFAEILVRRGLDDSAFTRRFLDPKLKHLTRPDKMADRLASARRLAVAIENQERICVFGDYDCDGMTATAILTEVLRTLGAKVAPLLANRFAGGYGLSNAAVERIEKESPSLVVTCDCGSSDHASLRALRDSGVDAVVIDHHLVPAEPLPALAFLNPHRPDCGFEYKWLASCGLVLSLAAELRAQLARPLDLRKWLDLVAIGTIADVAPLDGDNRALVRAGLSRIAAGHRPGLKALMQNSGLALHEPVTAEDVAFRLAPRLNAPGRLQAPDLSLDLLLAQSNNDAKLYADQVEQLGEQRKALQRDILEEAQAEVECGGYLDRPALVLGKQGWNAGLVGIVAGRLSDRYERPVIVIGFEGGHGRGSVRGPRGFRLFSALQRCAPLLQRFGGHQAAAGLEVRHEHLSSLREQFEQACAAEHPGCNGQASQSSAVLLSDADPLPRLVQDLLLLEPCGEKNPAPSVAVAGRKLSARSVKGGHLKLELELSRGERLSAFAPHWPHQPEELPDELLVVGQLGRDRFRGGDAVELRAETIQALE